VGDRPGCDVTGAEALFLRALGWPAHGRPRDRDQPVRRGVWCAL